MTTIRRVTIDSGAISAGGAATAYSEVVRGRILAVQINYPTNTCTVDLDSNNEFVAQKIMDLGAANTDATYYPRTPLHDYTGTAIDLSDAQGGNTAMYGFFEVWGRIKLTIASGTEAETVSVYVFVEEP